MKHLSIFLLSSMVTFAADFITGQGARITIGQRTFTSQDTGNPSATQLGAVGGVAYANNTLFVVDSNHIQATPVLNRVMIYQNISSYVLNPTTAIPQQGQRCAVCIGGDNVGGNNGAASLVLGQPDFVTTAINVGANGLRTPTGIATNGQILAVADTDNNRVLIWNSIPTVIGQPADLVLGQSNFTNGNVGLDAKSFRGPQGVWIQGNQFFVADTQNHRVMIWNNIPTTNDQPADLVLGEPSFPQGAMKTDPYLGTQEIFTQQVEATVPFTRLDAGAHPIQIKVTYQGCAEAGLCYPPISKVIFANSGGALPTPQAKSHPWEGVAILGGGFAFLFAGFLLRKDRHLDTPAA